MRDVVGNSRAAQATFVVDTIAPSYQIVAPAADSFITTNTPSVQVTYQDDGSGVDVSRFVLLVDGVDQTAVLTVGPGLATGTLPALADGQHTIQVTVFDRAGNQTAPPAVPQTFTVDTLPPAISYAISPALNAAGWNNSDATVTFTCTLGGAPLVSCTAPQTVTAEGANQQITGTVVDAAGFTGTVTATVSLDKTPPAVAITSPANGATVTSSALSITGTVSDALSGVAAVTCNGAPGTVQSGSFTCAVTLNTGSNSIAVQAADVAGNSASQSLNVTLAASGPVISSFSPASAPIGTQVTITGSNFMPTGSSPMVTLNQQGGGTLFAPIVSATGTSISFVIPAGAATGLITVTAGAQSASSVTPLTVVASSSFTLSVSPGSATLLPGQSITYQVSLASSDGFTELASLSLAGLPAGVTAILQPAQITAGQSSTLTLSAPAGQATGSSQITVTAAATVQGIPLSQSAAVALNVGAPGSLAFQGRVAVLDAYSTPLVGVTVRFTGRNYQGASTGCTASTTSDDSGNFVFAGLPSECGGAQLVEYDPDTVVAPAGHYSGVTLSYVLNTGEVTTPGLIIHLPRVDNAETVQVVQNSSVNQTFTFASIPGLSITVYAGTTFTRRDGSQPNLFPLSVVEIPYDRIPDKMPPDPTQDPVFAMSIEPYNSRSSQPVAITYPNRKNTAPGTNMPMVSLNPTLGMMVNYGTATVSADGTLVVPDPDPARPGHRYGISNFDWHFPLPTAGNAVNPCPEVCPFRAGDPVDLSSGLWIETTTDIGFGGARGNIAVVRTNRSLTTNAGSFGIGGNHNYGVLLNTANASNGLITLIMPDGNQFPFVRQGNGTFINTTIPSLRGAVLSIPSSGIYRIRWKDGTTYEFRPLLIGSPQTQFLTSITDPNGNIITLVRSSSAPVQIVQVVDPVGRALNLTYDGSNRITSITDPIGRITRYSYNAQGRLATFTDAAGGVTAYTYDSLNRVTSITNPRGITRVQNTYDANGRVIKQVFANAGEMTFEYTLMNEAVSTSPVAMMVVTDPRGNKTTFHFNATGFLIDETDALGGKTVYNVNSAMNLLLSTTDVLGRTTSFTYDPAGNVSTVTRLADTPNAVTTSFTYHQTFNKLTSVTDALGHTTSYEYDSAGNLTKTTDPLGHSSTFTYDNVGEMVTATDPLGNITRFAYSNGQLVRTTDPLGRVMTRVPDAIGRTVAISNALGQKTQYQYNARNQTTQISDPLGSQTVFAYDANGNPLAVSDALSHTTAYSYDNMDRAATRTDPLGRSESYQYDLNGNLTQFTDRRGVITAHSYDALDRALHTAFGGESSISYAYDAAGRPVDAVDSTTGKVVQRYDPLDRLLQEATPQGTVNYTYDNDGRRVGMNVSGQTAVGYSYDDADRVTQIAQESSAVTFAYDNTGRRTSLTLPNGVVMRHSYDAASQLTAINYELGAILLGNLTYSYDNAGRVTARGGTWARTGLPQAVASTSYDAANQLIQWNGSGLTYDANGNLTTNGSSSFIWNARNQLASIGATTFAYDALGRRRSKGSTSFLYDGLNAVQELNGASVSANILAGGLDQFFTRTDATATSALLTDMLSSIVALANPVGSITTEYTYDPFGGTTLSGPASVNPFQFTGRENDSTGLYYYRARYYNPTLGRFISEDPIGFAGGINKYAYVLNSPTSYTDPSGTVCVYSQTTGSMVCYPFSTIPSPPNFTPLPGPLSDLLAESKYGHPYYKETGYAGFGEGKNNPAAQDIREVGPLPQGNWLTSGPWYKHPKIGPNTINLAPLTGNSCFQTKRQCSTFRIHGDSTRHPGAASLGCIVLPRNRTAIPMTELVQVVP